MNFHLVISHFFFFSNMSDFRMIWKVITCANKSQKSPLTQILPSSKLKPTLFIIDMDIFKIGYQQLKFFLENNIHHFLNHRYEMFIERFLLLAIGNKPLNLLPGSNRRTHFLWSKVFFFFFLTGWNERYFSVLFYFHRGRKKENITTRICGNGS